MTSLATRIFTAAAAVAAGLGSAAPAAAQGNCDAISAQIDARIRASGVATFTLHTVETAQTAPGRVVGSCDKGARKILYLATAAPAGAGNSGTAPAAPRPSPRQADDGVLTECKDGSMSVGGTCGRR